MNHTLQFMPCHAISSYETPHIFSSKLPVLDLNPITIYHNHFNVYYAYLDKYTSLKNICDLIHIRIYLKKKVCHNFLPIFFPPLRTEFQKSTHKTREHLVLYNCLCSYSLPSYISVLWVIDTYSA